MKKKLSGFLSRIANEVFPQHVHCGFCMQALAEFDGSSRYCPQCKFPLY